MMMKRDEEMKSVMKRPKVRCRDQKWDEETKSEMKMKSEMKRSKARQRDEADEMKNEMKRWKGSENASSQIWRYLIYGGGGGVVSGNK